MAPKLTQVREQLLVAAMVTLSALVVVLVPGTLLLLVEAARRIAQ